MDCYEILEELFIDCFETNNLILDLIKIGKKANKKLIESFMRERFESEFTPEKNKSI